MTPPLVRTRTHGGILAVIALAALLPNVSVDLRAAGDGAAQTPNYELAAQWTLPKINKLIFDTQVTPHWLEFSDRFWYSYETRDGKRYFIVDPSTPLRTSPSAVTGPASTKAADRSVKAPLFNNAKLAAMLAASKLHHLYDHHIPHVT